MGGSFYPTTDRDASFPGMSGQEVRRLRGLRG